MHPSNQHPPASASASASLHGAANQPHSGYPPATPLIPGKLLRLAAVEAHTGRDLFETWSATADGHDAAATHSTWRSVKPGGGVGIGSLLRLAKQNGFTLPKPDQAPIPPNRAEQARIEREREQRQREELDRQRVVQADAAREAARLWAGASEAGASPYLARKGVQGHGVRFLPDGVVLVPLRDQNGALWNVQSIAPERPAAGTDKLFLKGGRKSGLWHWCGDPAGAAVLLIAEGYATAASLHEATGRPVAVAFDAGNLAHVAKALRHQYPAALLVLCGDDDCATEAKTRTNTGRVKAMAAARAVQGVAVFPAPLPAGEAPVNFDFNDLHAAHGLDAVGACIAAAVQAHQVQQAQSSASTTSPAKSRSSPTASTAQSTATACPLPWAKTSALNTSCWRKHSSLKCAKALTMWRCARCCRRTDA